MDLNYRGETASSYDYVITSFPYRNRACGWQNLPYLYVHEKLPINVLHEPPKITLLLLLFFLFCIKFISWSLILILFRMSPAWQMTMTCAITRLPDNLTSTTTRGQCSHITVSFAKIKQCLRLHDVESFCYLIDELFLWWPPKWNIRLNILSPCQDRFKRKNVYVRLSTPENRPSCESYVSGVTSTDMTKNSWWRISRELYDKCSHSMRNV